MQEKALIEKEKQGKLTLQKGWLSDNQLLKMMQRTPSSHTYRRPGKGGQDFDYVTGVYIKKILNWVFAWNWDFVIETESIYGLQIVVRGKLIVRDPSTKKQIIKTQYGRAEIKFKRGVPQTPENYLDIGNDFKAAATDCLKKCASELGIASDIYGKNEFREISEEKTPETTEELATKKELDEIASLIEQMAISPKMVKAILKKYKVEKFEELAKETAVVIIRNLQNKA